MVQLKLQTDLVVAEVVAPPAAAKFQMVLALPCTGVVLCVRIQVVAHPNTCKASSSSSFPLESENGTSLMQDWNFRFHLGFFSFRVENGIAADESGIWIHLSYSCHAESETETASYPCSAIVSCHDADLAFYPTLMWMNHVSRSYVRRPYP